MPEVERNATKAAEKAGEEEQSWEYVFEPKEKGQEEDQKVLEKAQDLEPESEQHQKSQNRNGVVHRFPILAALPQPLEMLGTPFDQNDTTISDTNTTSTAGEEIE